MLLGYFDPQSPALSPRYLFIRYQLANILYFDGRNRSRLPQMPFSLLSLARKNVLFVCFVAFDFTASSDAKPFRRRFVGFNFWHFVLLKI